MLLLLKPTIRSRPPITKFSVISNCLLHKPLLSSTNLSHHASFTTSIRKINPIRSHLASKLSHTNWPSQQTRTFAQATPKQKEENSEASKDVTHNKPQEPTANSEPTQQRLVWKDLFRLFSLAKYDSKLLSLAIFLLLISCSIGLTLPKAYGLVLDATKSVIDGELPPIIYGLSLYEFIGITGGFLLLGVAANYGRVILLRILGEKLVARLRANVLKKTISQDAEFFDIHKVGDLVSRLSTDAFVVSRSMTQNISDGFKATITGSVGIAAMFLISPQLASVVVFFIPPVMIGTAIFGNKVRKISRGIQQATGNLSKIGEEQLNSIKTVQSFVAEAKELRKYNSGIRGVFALGRKEAKLNATFYASTAVIGDFSFLIILAYGAKLVASGSLTVGDLAAFMLYAEYAHNAMYSIASFYSELMKGTGAASRLFDLIDRKPRIHASIGEPVRGKPRGEIEFKDVSFSYPTRPKIQIFNELNFKIPENSNVCVVGPSGRGKSTITALMLRYYDISSGQILLDGKDISKYSAKSLRRHLGVVQQEPILMSGTIRDNITYGLKSENVPEEEIIEAAKKANCHDFIDKFPDGYDTVIGPRGALLSGGQKQRISIARALIKNPAVLILDEATSALDSKSEYAINQTLQQLMKDEKMTTISIAHRLSTIRKADMVIVLGYDGKVAETGKFETLYADRNSALYRLLNEDKSDTNERKDAKKKKKRKQDSEETEEDGFDQQEFTQEFIRNEIIHKALEDIKFDQPPVVKPEQIEQHPK